MGRTGLMDADIGALENKLKIPFPFALRVSKGGREWGLELAERRVGGS